MTNLQHKSYLGVVSKNGRESKITKNLFTWFMDDLASNVNLRPPFPQQKGANNPKMPKKTLFSF